MYVIWKMKLKIENENKDEDGNEKGSAIFFLNTLTKPCMTPKKGTERFYLLIYCNRMDGQPQGIAPTYEIHFNVSQIVFFQVVGALPADLKFVRFLWRPLLCLSYTQESV